MPKSKNSLKPCDAITAYLTRDCLTSGEIAVVEAVVCGSISAIGVAPDASRAFATPRYYHGTDWHLTPKDAMAKAEKMRAAKIQSLKKRIERLEKMKFWILEK